MDSVIKAEWTARLRSGRYAQGKHSLRAKLDGQERFCCLGVLCELAVEEGVVEPSEVAEEVYRYGANGTAGSLPEEVRNWTGLTSYGRLPEETAGDERVGLNATDLSDLNDSGMPFSVIADIIDEYL